MTETNYPEHQKLQAIKDKSQAIGEFLDWLTSVKNYRIAKWIKYNEEDPESDSTLQPACYPIERLLAEYFGINQNKLEQEKRAMLDTIREMNKK